MSLYFIGSMDRLNLELYGKYELDAFKSLEMYDGVEALAVCDDPKLVEGVLPGKRVVLFKIRDQATFDKWYNSPEYQAAKALRLQSADTKFLLTVDAL
jgi:uncharacterized protein (DUF1330 family)